MNTLDDLRVLGRTILEGPVSLPALEVGDAQIPAGADIDPDKLAQRVLAAYPQKLTDCRIHDAFQTLLPGTPSSNDLGLIGGTFGTNHPELKTGNMAAGGNVTWYARLQIPLPPNYEDGQTVNIVVKGGMEGSVADVVSLVDIEAYQQDGNGGISSDLCATSAQSINSTTAAEKSFTITPTNLVAGDVLDTRLSVIVNDAATAASVVAAVGSLTLKCDTRG